MPNPTPETVTPPLMSFRFEVVITLKDAIAGIDSPVCDAAFSECSGLDMTMEPKTYVQGGEHYRQKHLMGPVSYGRLSLRRGMTSNLHLWTWFAAAAIPGKQRHTADAEVRVMNTDGTPAMTFKLDDCLPVKVSGPSLNAQDGRVAIESLELVYGYLSIKGSGKENFGLSAQANFSAGVNLGISGGVSVSGGAGLSGSFDANAKIGFGVD
jgi:phage tail-like protein